MQDQFYHRYSYDAENKLTTVLTSRDQVYWEKDATYEYYRHGPLSRTIIGQNQVQGIDYAYTLQGWLKGVNTTSGSISYLGGGSDCGPNSAVDNLIVNERSYPYQRIYKARRSVTFDVGFTSSDNDPFEVDIDSTLGSCSQTTGVAGSDGIGSHGLYDMGQDGLTTSGGGFISNGTNVQTADAYGFSLNYYTGDYKAISSTVTPFASYALPLPPGPGSIATGSELFNGNIASMAVSIPKLGPGMI